MEVLPSLSSEPPGLLEQRPCTLLVAGRVERPSTLQQIPDADHHQAVGQLGLDRIQQRVRFVELTLQGVGAGDLGAELQQILGVPPGAGGLDQRVELRLGAGGVAVVPQRVEVVNRGSSRGHGGHPEQEGGEQEGAAHLRDTTPRSFESGWHGSCRR